MFDTSLAVGDPVTWWSDTHGRGVEPADPAAVRRTGIIAQVHRSPSDPSRIVAYSVACCNTLGEYLVTLRPDYGHQPTRTTK
ncbi:hypothetical protein OG874_37630 [Nocardia sp. NBC_00565]|uniref:hypothetical protein n=1 Tax=Nocardia sp. NBC_00565 TaxID=2975993 RepID=UPI002E810C39|nr:hypothetical protein [Nocardia sp. NBC_00565]WUC02388.1 hypothetical protein OG874_37630 [Nocardia sp. NBC_00565]